MWLSCCFRGSSENLVVTPNANDETPTVPVDVPVEQIPKKSTSLLISPNQRRVRPSSVPVNLLRSGHHVHAGFGLFLKDTEVKSEGDGNIGNKDWRQIQKRGFLTAAFDSPKSGDSQMSTEEKEKEDEIVESPEGGEDVVCSENSDDDNDIDDDDDEDEKVDIVEEDPRGTKMKPPPAQSLPPESAETIWADDLDTMRDPVAFEFEVTTSVIPEHNYPTLFPEEMQSLCLRRYAVTDDDWRESAEAKAADYSEEDELLVDHLIRLEKMQIVTESFERGRRESVRKAFRENQEASRLARSLGRPASGRVGSARKNRNCIKDCVQVACAGECPTKTARPKICPLCRQVYCMGTCVKHDYWDHERAFTGGPPEEIMDLLAVPPAKPKPACGTCQGSRAKSAQVRILNGNNIVLGRPKTLQATYSSGAHSRKPIDMRRSNLLQPNSTPADPMNYEMISRFEKIGLAPVHSTASPQRRTNRAKGRNSVVPGKSYVSNRKESLTGLAARSAAFEASRMLDRKKKTSLRSRPNSAKV